MNRDSLKITVHQSTNKLSFTADDETENTVNKIVVGVVLYKLLLNLLSINSKVFLDNIKDTSDSYAKTYYNIVSTLKSKYISYKELLRLVKSYRVSSFLALTEKQIDELYTIYQNKQEIKPFNESVYSLFTYRVYKITEQLNQRLLKLHYKVFVPIVQYYKQFRLIQNSDVTLDSASTDSPDKVIKIAISSVPCTRIYADIGKDLFNCLNIIYSYQLTSDGYVQITFK